MRASLLLFELLLVTVSLGCEQPKKVVPKPASVTSAPARLRALLVPRPASRFRVVGHEQRQDHPRLPDTGEWRCAERERVVWCAGGQPAAGVVGGPPDRRFRCGARWGKDDGERVCIDAQPDYPGDAHQCAFEQERGIARVCRAAEPGAVGRPAPEQAVPACWLDRDCPSGGCDRGACTCTADASCRIGRCAGGVCVEVKQ